MVANVDRKRQTSSHEVTNLHANRKSRFDSNCSKSDENSEFEQIDYLANTKNPSDLYKSIPMLLKNARSTRLDCVQSLSSLCRLFSQLVLSSSLRKQSDQTQEEIAVTEWLQTCYCNYLCILCEKLSTSDFGVGKVILAQTMHLAQAEIESDMVRGTFQYNKDGILSQVLLALLARRSSDLVEYFSDIYATVYCELWAVTTEFVTNLRSNKLNIGKTGVNNAISLLAKLSVWHQRGKSQPTLLSLLSGLDGNVECNTLSTLSRAWEAIIELELSESDRQRLLELVPTHVGPQMLKPEILLDFLTDSSSLGGNESLLALAGIHYLLKTKTVDYPSLYSKLYAVVDANALHKKQRSHLIRLLENLLSSSHLSATMVASFIKRLSRLCLYAPPSAIVVIIPLIYNLVQSHKVCSVMMHRVENQLRAGLHIKDVAQMDVYNPSELNPSDTNAIESSLWELNCLRSHWHPNVATISKIIAEQFLRQSYDTEQFLDHSYKSFIDTEITKTIAKEPATNHLISRSIFDSAPFQLSPHGTTVKRTWSFGTVVTS